mmetsp:Transcript_23210/g.53735  ORF Transcript_23210/g.53735 Transcript_23210/m.53735 type:complete len:357 (+) Transcript_23210:2051-3121(+)
MRPTARIVCAMLALSLLWTNCASRQSSLPLHARSSTPRSSRPRCLSRAADDEDSRGQCATVYPLADEASAGGDAGFVVLRTLPGGDSLYHAVALSLRYTRDGEVGSLFWSALPAVSMSLRESVVKCFADRSRLLHLGGAVIIASADLVDMAAKRRLGAGASSFDYLKSVYKLGEYSGGAELAALVNELRRPANVYEPRLAVGGGIELARVALIGAPTFSDASAMNVLALDSLGWRCDDDREGIVFLNAGGDGDRGVHFHALLPARVSSAEAARTPVREKDEATERMRERVARSPEAIAAIQKAAQDPRFVRAVTEIAKDPSRAADYAKDPEMAQMLALVVGVLQGPAAISPGDADC